MARGALTVTWARPAQERRPRLLLGVPIQQQSKTYQGTAEFALLRINDPDDAILQRPDCLATLAETARSVRRRRGRFTAAYPKLDLRVSATNKQVDLVAQRVDLAVRHGDEEATLRVGSHTCGLSAGSTVSMASVWACTSPPRGLGNRLWTVSANATRLALSGGCALIAISSA